ncbi:MAG: hypothetical protein CVT76_10625 [Alphaproteobacteria bacterium HGW-Alphaproteobacteria-15]|jgi:hypothetical protein|nr:MAG: hypothetical protein CVT76_10625 [Alphaproteobacteria bacterium HGW-Alphaproteobacteria-15]
MEEAPEGNSPADRGKDIGKGDSAAKLIEQLRWNCRCAAQAQPPPKHDGARPITGRAPLILRKWQGTAMVPGTLT